MPTYTVKIKGKAHSFVSDLTDNEAIIRLRKLVKKGIVKGPFAVDLLKRALGGQLTPGWIPYVHFLAVSKKVRQEFGSDRTESESRTHDVPKPNPNGSNAKSLISLFGYQGAIQGLKDSLRSSHGVRRARLQAALGELEAMPDPEAVRTPRKWAVLIED